MRFLFGIVVACIAAGASAQDVARGKVVYEWICAACHGPEAEGQKALQAPSLRMQQDWYLQGQLEKFRAGLRGAHRGDTSGGPMQLTATSLDDQQIADVVAYVVSLGTKGLPASQHVLVGDEKQGQALYATCAGCHGTDARGNPALRAPSLAGQWDWYLARQLGKFKAGIRGGDAKDAYGAQMAPFATMLADETAFRDIAVYIRSLPTPQTGQPPAVPDLANGAKAFSLCASCHGDQAQGNAAFHAPYLAGQGTWYVVRQLLNFRRGVRGSEHQDAFGTQMRALVGNVTDETILDVAGYVASLTPPSRREPTPGFGGDLTLGKQIFAKTCAPCHGTSGQGNRVLSAPSLAGQEDRYLARQLNDFRAGIRGADRRDPPGRIMRAWAASLADDHEIQSVAAYVASLEPLRAHDVTQIAAGEGPRASSQQPASASPPGAPRPAAGSAGDPRWPRGLLSPGGPGAQPGAAILSGPNRAGSTPGGQDAGGPSNAATQPSETRAPGVPDLAAGEAIFTTCVGCHGLQGQGNQTLRAPALAGLGDWYVAEQVRKFRRGVRGAHPTDVGGSSMRPMASTLASDQAILDVAAFVGQLPIHRLPPITGNGDPTRGSAFYATCAACHGPDATGNTALKAPALASQADWYLVAQLQNYRSGVRGAHPEDAAGAMMRPMAMGLADDAALRDVAAYIVRLARGGLATPAAKGPEQAVPAGNAVPPAAAGPTPPAAAVADAPTAAAVPTAAKAPVADAPAVAPASEAVQALASSDSPPAAKATGAEKTPTSADAPTAEKAPESARAPAVPAAPQPLLGDPGRGQVLYATCVACHGANGAGSPPLKAPALAGQAPWYVVTQLRNFKAGIRGAHADDSAGALMRPMAAMLADEQALLDVASYAVGLPGGTTGTATLGGDAARGKSLYAACAACHGPEARGNEALKAPGLAGQEDWYVATQLKNFKAGIRGTHAGDTAGALMRPMAATLVDEQAIFDVAAFLASLPTRPAGK